MAGDPTPKCYTNGSNSWIVDNLDVYLTFCSADDLRSFSSNEALLQQFSVDNKTLALVKTLNLTEDLLVYYAQLLTTQNSSYSLDNIPPNVLCYAIANLNIDGITDAQAMATLNLLKTCNYSSSYTVNQEALSGLLSSVSEITSEVLTSLGSLAVGLPTSTILQIRNGTVIMNSISTLSAITGWSITQASAIVTKLIEVNYQITAKNLENLGSLIIGLPSSKIDSLTSKDIRHLTAISSFTTYMEQAPVALQQRFILKVIQVSSTQSIFQSVPANLASNIPASKLITPTFNISVINQMKWKASQAQVFFQIVLIQVTDYSMLSSNVLQGFTCGAAKNLNDAQFVSLIKSMTGKSVNLGSSQLNCLSKKLTTNGAQADFTSYSSDVLLYLGPYTASSQCKEYFTRVGKANINLLAQGSAKRVALLNSARSCLNIGSATIITKDTLQTLGSLVCDLTAQEINNSDSYVLQALQSCSSFTDSQKSAILLKLKAIYGGPTTWSVSTLKKIGTLFSTIDSSTLRLINTAVKRQFFPGFLTVIKIQYKTVFTSVMSQLKVPARLITRAASYCEELTTDMITKQQEYIVATYTATQLDECLSNTTLKENLEILGSLAFDNDQLQVLKNKLDTIFPIAVPEPYLLQIGNIAMMYNMEEISQWNITTVDTLEALLEGASWKTNDSKINALVTQYLHSPNASLDGTALTVLAPYICGLNETLIQKITDNEFLNSSKPLDTSTCTQAQKDLLYSMMTTAYSSFDNSSNAYFQIISPVIGGAKFEDLLLYAKGFPEMDLITFTGLNPDVVKKLGATIIRDLLGSNILDINTISSSAVVQAWVSVHTQTEIKELGLNVSSGVNETIPIQGSLTLNDIAELVIKTDVLQNKTLLTFYLSKVELKNTTAFVTSLSSAAQKANLSRDQVNTVKETLLAVELQQLQSSFSNYTSKEWQVLFETDLTVLIENFNQTILWLLPINITCDSYQAIIRGLSLANGTLSDEVGTEIYNEFIKTYLTKQLNSTGTTCGASDYQTWTQINLGYFFKYSTFTDLINFNKNLTQKLLASVDSSQQVSKSRWDKLLNMFANILTLNATAEIVIRTDVLQNETLLILYLSKVDLKNVTAFVTALSSSAIQANVSQENVTFVKETLLAVEVKQLQSTFTTYTSKEWKALLETDLVVLIQYFNQTILGFLPSNITCDSYQAIKVDLKNVTAFVTALSSSAIQANVSQENVTFVKETLLAVEVKQLQSTFTTYTSKEWKALLETDLVVLIQYFNQTILGFLPSNITCDSYQAIKVDLKNVTAFVTALSSSAIQANVSQENVTFVKETLLAVEVKQLQSTFTTYTSKEWKALLETDLVVLIQYFNQTILGFLPRIACDASDYATWKQINFGDFIKYTTSEDLTRFNKNLTGNILTLNATADIVIRTDVLQNETLLILYLSKVDLKNVTAFVTALSSSAIQANVSQENVTFVKETLLAVEVKQLQSNFTTYTSKEWKALLETDLVVLIQYFNQTILGFLPSNITCDSYQAMKSVFRFLTLLIFTWKLLASVDSSSQQVSKSRWDKLLNMFANILTLNATADIVIRTDVLQNETLLILYLSKVDLKNVTAFVTALSSSAIQANVSQENVTFVKETLLAVEVKQLQSNFTTYTSKEWKALLETDLVVLIQYFNQTILGFLPSNITCDSYQAM
ncbi:uncharacterized protein RB166_015995 [Leptodactylus fuscus]